MIIDKTNPVAVSVIMAVYNSERYINDAIKSILEQTFRNLELIIVNDGSTDNSLELARNFAALDNRIKLITQTNQGIGSATQRGLNESQGEYIAIMDSDDISLPNRLATQKQYLYRHPDIDGVGCQWRMLSADGSEAGIDIHPTNPECVAILRCAYYAVHHPTSMVRRTAFEKVGGYSTDRSCLVPDYDVFMRMQEAGSQFNPMFYFYGA